MNLNPLPRLLLLMALVCGVHLSAFAQCKIYGIVRNEAEPLPGAKVLLWREGILVNGQVTDMDGKYQFLDLEPGTYTVQAEADFLKAKAEVTLGPSEYRPLDLMIREEGPEPQPCLCPDHRPAFDPWNAVDLWRIPSSDAFFRHENDFLWQQQLTRKIDDLAARTPGMVQLDLGDPLHYRGSRSESNLTLIDGRKVRGSDELPFAALKEVQVLTGGLPAEYGDATGAVIMVTTRPPQYHCKPDLHPYWDRMPRIREIW